MAQNNIWHTRNHAIDMVKLIASFFVICIHTKTTSAVDHFEQHSFSFIVDNVARFAVPFFFAISGYLIDFTNRSRLLRRLLIIAVLYTLWSLIFIFIRSHNGLEYPVFAFTNNALWNERLNIVYKILFYGYERHLWFFPAYIIGALAVMATRKHVGILIVLALGFYFAGLTGQQFKIVHPPQVSFLPEPTYDWLQRTYFTRSGLFFAFPCMAAGYLIKQFRQKTDQWPMSMMVFTIAVLFVLQYFECILMMNRYNVPASDYYATTIFLTASILILAVKSTRERPFVKNAGKLAGGVYIIHPLFMYFFFINYKGLFEHELWPYVFTPLLFVLSLVTAIIVGRIPFVRKTIMI